MVLMQDLKKIPERAKELQVDEESGNLSSYVELDGHSLWYIKYKEGNGAEAE